MAHGWPGARAAVYMLLLIATLSRLPPGREMARLDEGMRNRGSIEPGTRIAGYEVVRVIGQGGMSEVYEAIQSGTSRPIALKLLGGRRADEPRYVERLRREGYALARIRHPNVVVVYDAGVTDGQAWIAMDLLEGQSLRDLLIDRRRLPLPQALAYASAIFDGLEAAHRLGIIHRDMKPENVFLSRDGGLKIVDFGNAKLLNSGLKSTDPHKIFGTAAYMSPEQLGFHRGTGPRSDLYAVGLMLYEMLYGRHPFSDGPDPYDLPPSIELCRLQIEVMPPPLTSVEPKIPAFVSDFVMRLVAKDPGDRPSSAFLAAREARDMHDYILREARSAGLTPATVAIGGSRSPLERAPTAVSSSQPEFSRSVLPVEPRSSPTQSTTTAMAVGAILGTVLFAIISVSRYGGQQARFSTTIAGPAARARLGVPSAGARVGLPVAAVPSPAETIASAPRPSSSPPPTGQIANALPTAPPPASAIPAASASRPAASAPSPPGPGSGTASSLERERVRARERAGTPGKPAAKVAETSPNPAKVLKGTNTDPYAPIY